MKSKFQSDKWKYRELKIWNHGWQPELSRCSKLSLFILKLRNSFCISQLKLKSLDMLTQNFLTLINFNKYSKRNLFKHTNSFSTLFINSLIAYSWRCSLMEWQAKLSCLFLKIVTFHFEIKIYILHFSSQNLDINSKFLNTDYFIKYSKQN